MTAAIIAVAVAIELHVMLTGRLPLQRAVQLALRVRELGGTRELERLVDAEERRRRAESYARHMRASRHGGPA
jgi:hypothetical protein